MAIESYTLFFVRQTKAAVLMSDGDPDSRMWLPKSQIEIDGISTAEDYESLKDGEELDVYIPDWLAEKNDLL